MVVQGVRTFFGFLYCPLYAIVRSCRRAQHDAARNPSARSSAFRLAGRRSTLPVCNPTVITPPASPLGPLQRRKRKAEDDNETMRHKKKAFARSPWEDEPWMQFGREHTPLSDFEFKGPDVVKEATPPPAPTAEQIRLVRQLRRDRKHKPRRTAYKFKTFKPRYEPYRRPDCESSRTPCIYLTQSPNHPYELMDRDIEMSPSPEKTKETAPEEIACTEKVVNVVENKDITLTQPSSLKKNTVIAGSVQRTEDKSTDEDDWDANDDTDFRAALRVLDSSYDERGFKVPIFGWVSPETQKYNVKHAKKLAKEEEAAESATTTETPLRPPSSRMSTADRIWSIMPHWAILNKSPMPPSTQLVNDVVNSKTPLSSFKVDQDKSFDSVQKNKEESVPFTPLKELQKKEQTPCPDPRIKAQVKKEKTPTSTSAQVMKEESAPTVKEQTTAEEETTTTPQPVNKAESFTELQSAAQKQKELPQVVETPYKQLYSLSLNDEDTHTPKAKIFTVERTVRTTRAQRLREEREAAKDQYKIVPLGPQWIEKVRAAARSGAGELKPYDIARAVPQYSTSRGQDNWLNDEVINSYLDLIAKHGRQGDREGQVPTHHAFNSFFYKRIQTDGPQAVLRWSKRAKVGGKALLETEKLFIPINQGMHWTLCVVEVKAHKKITVYNSMGTLRGQEVCDKVLSWIEKELGKDFNANEWTLDPAGHSPQQTNSDDCGVFTITNARQIMLGKMGTIELGRKMEAYGEDLISIQRERIVAELINGGLLTAKESKA